MIVLLPMGFCSRDITSTLVQQVSLPPPMEWAPATCSNVISVSRFFDLQAIIHHPHGGHWMSIIVLPNGTETIHPPKQMC